MKKLSLLPLLVFAASLAASGTASAASPALAQTQAQAQAQAQSQAQAQPMLRAMPQLGVQAPALQLIHVTSESDRSVTVFYASGSPARFAVDGGVPLIRTIEAGPVTASVGSDGSASVPATFVSRVGFQIFNYLVVIIRQTSSVPALIKNADGTMPSADGTVSSANTNPASFDNDRVVYLPVHLNGTGDIQSVVKIGATQVVPGGSSPIVVDLSSTPPSPQPSSSSSSSAGSAGG